MNIKLREIERADLHLLNKWRNNYDLVSNLGAGFRYLSQEIDERWFNDYLSQRDKNVRLAIEFEGQYVGNINLTQINYVNRSAEFSIMIGETSMRGKGIGMSASQQVLKHGFNDLGLHRIWLTCTENNEIAFHLYKKLGFEVEGVMRNAVYKDGCFKNLILMSVLNSLDPEVSN